MTLRPLSTMTALLFAGVVQTPVQAADLADKALQCATVLEITMSEWPSDYPHMAEAKTLQNDWVELAKAMHYPKILDAKAEIATGVTKVQSTLIEMRGNPAGSQAYMAGLAQGCKTVPFKPVSPALCKTYSNSQVESEKLSIDMLNYNASLASSGGQRAENQKDLKASRKALERAQAALNHYGSAGAMTQDEALSLVSTLDPDKLRTEYDICLNQMGVTP